MTWNSFDSSVGKWIQPLPESPQRLGWCLLGQGGSTLSVRNKAGVLWEAMHVLGEVGTEGLLSKSWGRLLGALAINWKAQKIGIKYLCYKSNITKSNITRSNITMLYWLFSVRQYPKHFLYIISLNTRWKSMFQKSKPRYGAVEKNVLSHSSKTDRGIKKRV